MIGYFVEVSVQLRRRQGFAGAAGRLYNSAGESTGFLRAPAEQIPGG
jgi:hypothetical protein